jgi:hypothetical protein
MSAVNRMTRRRARKPGSITSSLRRIGIKYIQLSTVFDAEIVNSLLSGSDVLSGGIPGKATARSRTRRHV